LRAQKDLSTGLFKINSSVIQSELKIVQEGRRKGLKKGRDSLIFYRKKRKKSGILTFPAISDRKVN